MHPLYNDNLNELSDDALHKKHGELLKRMVQASRLGYVDVVRQIQAIIQHLDQEITRRNYETIKKLDKDNKDFDNYINIG